VQELGEETFPEPKSTDAISAASQSQAMPLEQTEAAAKATSQPSEASPETSSTDEHSPSPSSSSPSSEPSTVPTSPTPTSTEDSSHQTTTQQRKPLPIPESVHVRITPEVLKDYVGPPVYQKDRMYLQPPPPGVSTGLGYLGNGSGAVMPVEAMVNNIVVRYSAND
jgi:ATP-dependent Lon protease